MVTPELLDYIKGAKQRGVGDDAIRGVLTKNGWKQTDIEEAYNLTPKEIFATEPPPTSRQFLSEKNSPPKETISQRMNLAPAQPRKSRWKGLLITLIILLLLAGGAVFGYYNFSEYFDFHPEKKIFQSVFNLAEVTGATADGFLLVKSEGTDVKISVEGAFFKPAVNQFKETGKVILDVFYTPPATFEPSDVAPSPIQLTVSLDTRILDNVLYLRLDPVSSLGDLGKMGFDTLKGQWIKVPLKEAEELSKEKVLPEADKFAPLSNEDVDAINKKYANVDRLIIDKKGKETLNGESTSYYVFHLNPEMRSFLKELLDESLVKKGASAQDTTDANTKFDESFASLLDHKVEMWIAKDGLPRKITFEATVKSPATEFSESKESQVNSEASFKDFNKDITVDAPLESKTFDEILQTIFASPTVPISATSSPTMTGSTTIPASTTSSPTL
ncbi:MAG: hypothetical protein ABI430_03530 [Candidatus Taylorbacteria bacterium]